MNIENNINLIYTIPFYINKDLLKDELKLSKDCMYSISKCNIEMIIVFNQGDLNNIQLNKFLSKFNINFVIIGDGYNVGICKARKLMLEHIIKYYPKAKYMAEIHLDMIFTPNWDKVLIEYLENSIEPIVSPRIIYYEDERYYKYNGEEVFFEGNIEERINLLLQHREERIELGFVHPVIHKIEALKSINGYNTDFLVGKQGYEDDSILIGYSYYMGTKYKWNPKCNFNSCVYHRICTQRFNIDNKEKEWEINNNGLKKQYGAYGQLELARMRPEYKERFEREYYLFINNK